MNKKMTIKDLAEIAGVNHSTVSRALNDSPRVSKATRIRIQQLAKDLHFEFNTVGRSLSKGESGNVAVIHAGDWDGFGTSQYFNILFSSLRKELEKRKMDALILEAYNPETGESNIARLIRQNKADAFLIVDPGVRTADYTMLLEANKPFVQLHTYPKFYNIEGLDYYVTDNRVGGYLAAEHLIACGCRKIINITACKHLSGEFSMRFEGYKSALQNAGIPFDANLVCYTDCSYQSGYQAVYANQELFKKADGIFAQADVVAFGCLTALKELGLRVPDDLGLVGFDDTPLCMLPTPTITSIHQPVEELTRSACDRILSLLGKEDIPDESAEDRTVKLVPVQVLEEKEQRKLQPWLVERGSTFSKG